MFFERVSTQPGEDNDSREKGQPHDVAMVVSFVWAVVVLGAFIWIRLVGSDSFQRVLTLLQR